MTGRRPVASSRPERRRGGEGAFSKVGLVTTVEPRIETLWDHRDDLTAAMPESEVRDAIHGAIDLLDRRDARVAEVVDGQVVVHQALKRAILLLLRISKMETIELGQFQYATPIPPTH